MKLTRALIFALSGASLALPDFDCPATTGLPECGIGCLVEAAIAIGCGVENVSCECASTSQLEERASSCVVQRCTNLGAVEQLTSAAQAICESCNTAGSTANTVISIPNIGSNTDTWGPTTSVA